jgi:hypothetical protein
VALRGLAGSGRRALAAAGAPAGASGVGGWAGEHPDQLRVSGCIVAAIVLLAWGSWTALLVVGAVLVVYQVVLSVIARQPSEPATPAPTPA